MTDLLQSVFNWVVSVNLEDYIKVEYCIMLFFFTGLLTNLFNKPKWVKYKVLITLCLVLTLFFIRALIANAALKFNGNDGQTLADVLNNDVLRFLFNAALTTHLVYRFFKVCCLIRFRDIQRLKHPKGGLT